MNNNAPHTVKSYEDELKNLNLNIVKMGALCEEALKNSIDSLVEKNQSKAENVISNDEKIDNFESKIEQQVVDLIALRQPMAIDLRETVTALKISSDLERIGDLSKNISKRSLLLSDNLDKQLIQNFKLLAEKVQKQLKSVIDAYLERSAEIAINVWENDEKIDEITNDCMQNSIDFLKKDKNNMQNGTHLLFISKKLEKNNFKYSYNSRSEEYYKLLNKNKTMTEIEKMFINKDFIKIILKNFYFKFLSSRSRDFKYLLKLLRLKRYQYKKERTFFDKFFFLMYL